MGKTPDQSVSDSVIPVRETRPYRSREFRDDITAPVPVLADDDPRHGTINGYVNFTCRCAPCKTARAEYGAARRAKDKANAA